MTRRLTILIALLPALCLLFAATAMAQEAAPVQQAPVVSSGRSYWFEIVLILVLFGAALFAICRSSLRR